MSTDLSHSLRVVVLGSGSSGNAVAVTDGLSTVLVDCGFSTRETVRRMELFGLDPAAVSAVVLTHEHSDHVRGVEVFARKYATPVYASAGTLRASGLVQLVADARTVSSGAEQTVGTLTVLPFTTSHDAAEPLGYCIRAANGERAGIVTDTGVLTEEAAEALAGCDILALESNHDVRMLESGRYPQFLKSRIRSARGHLANEQAAEALALLASNRLQHVIALHRSRENNHVDLVMDALVAALDKLGHGARVTAAEQATACSAGGILGDCVSE